MTRPCFFHRLLVPALSLPFLLGGCSLAHKKQDESQVIYALPPRPPGATPLAGDMKVIGGPFVFSRERFVLTEAQINALARAAGLWAKDKTKMLVVGFAQRGLPPDYARVLAHRRAESVRQVLIEHGLDAANIHSAGYGNDVPSLGSDDSATIYELK